MSEIKIKAESFPERCEICHQIDCFDPVKNSCSRCNNLVCDNTTTFSKSDMNSVILYTPAAFLALLPMGASFLIFIGIGFESEWSYFSRVMYIFIGLATIVSPITSIRVLVKIKELKLKPHIQKLIMISAWLAIPIPLLVMLLLFWITHRIYFSL